MRIGFSVFSKFIFQFVFCFFLTEILFYCWLQARAKNTYAYPHSEQTEICVLPHLDPIYIYVWLIFHPLQKVCLTINSRNPRFCNVYDWRVFILSSLLTVFVSAFIDTWECMWPGCWRVFSVFLLQATLILCLRLHDIMLSQLVLLCMISNDCLAPYWGSRGAYVMSYQANAILKA